MSPDLKLGSFLLDRWEIIEFLGEGTLGKVYRARDKALGRDVAIKQLRPEIASDTEAIKRFEKELRTIGRLKHPNIVIIHHYVERDPVSGDCFSIMEYVGGNLRDYMKKKGALPVAEALRIAVAICKPLAEVHFKSITHNDLKPANILLDEEGDEIIPKISDFGSRTAYISDEHRYLYISPEELERGKGKSATTDTRSDLYSLGVILYEMLTGQVPFPSTGKLDDVVSGHLYQQPLPPHQKRACISQAIDRVVLKALQKVPSYRYQTASDMAEALEQALEEWEAELKKLHATAKDHLNQEEWSKAAELYKDILEKNPYNQEAEKALECAQGMSDLSEKKWEQAAKRLRAVVEDPKYPYAAEGLQLARRLEAAGLYAKALELDSKEEWPQVIKVLDKIIEFDGGYKNAAQRLKAKAENQSKLQHSYEEAEEFLKEEKWAEAAAKFEEIEEEAGQEYKEIAPKLEKAKRQEKLRNLYKQGMTHFDNKDWPKAIAALEKVAQLNPTYREVCIKLAHARREQTLESSYSRGMAHFKKREWEKAIQSLHEVVQLAPEYNEDAVIKLAEARKFDLYDQAVSYLQRRDWQQAIEKLEGASLIDAEYSDAAAKLKEARTQLKLESLWAEAIKHEKAKQWREAIGIYFQIQELAPTDEGVPARLEIVIRNNRLQLLYFEGKKLLADTQWQEAYYKFKEVVDKEPNFEDAAKLLKEARVGRLSSLYTRARERERAEEWDKAIQIYAEILEIDPYSRKASRRLERAKQRRRGSSESRSTLPVERRDGLEKLSQYRTPVIIVAQVIIGLASDAIAGYFRVDTLERLLLVAGILLISLGILYFILPQEGSSNV